MSTAWLRAAAVGGYALVRQRVKRRLLHAGERGGHVRAVQVLVEEEVRLGVVLPDPACSMPQAEKAPGKRGTTVSAMPSSRARNTACIGPAPPKATRAESRGSMPRDTVMVRMACAILALATSQMPSAIAAC